MASRHSPSTSTFDFTKTRKRWPEILLTELSDVIVLLLSPRGKILYCGTGVEEILGWRDSEVVAMDITQLVADDFTTFLDAFRQAIQTNSEMLVYSRFISKPPSISQQLIQSAEQRSVLLEVKGYPCFTDAGPQAFFAVCAPYPSKGLEMLNTVLHLKLEHERLRDRAAFLRSCLPPEVLSQTQKAQSPIEVEPKSQLTFLMDSGEDKQDGPTISKKSRRYQKAGHADQHVCTTCGRTDSPEWRKGPMGPKSLCNACGLRWSKQAKKNTSDGC
ncbi:blue light receptor [Flagelloscypha sp. PMI_526]|nr:blue light receptor [Flagelloscypha sp. PMI_526]